jgi:oligoribonuclease NrnB/cAMP/cGMP phosphodiesterase (DHH superfamily)
MEPNNVNFVIYHKDCSDGFGAAWAAWKLLGNRAEYYAAAHGDEPPDITGKYVVCLDFAYDNETTKKMIEDAEDFYIIDHHKTNMVRLHDISQAHFDMTKSGAVLAWEFFHPGKDVPKFMQYIQDRDLWKFENPYSKEFSAAFDMVPFEFEEFDAFLDDSVFDDAVKRGSYILAHKRTFINKIIDSAADKILAGYDAKVVNASHWQSEIGNMLAHQASIGIVWFYDHQRMLYKVSLRSLHKDIDVAEIASKFGGGGHPPAAGFQHEGASIEEIFDNEAETSTEKD